MKMLASRSHRGWHAFHQPKHTLRPIPWSSTSPIQRDRSGSRHPPLKRLLLAGRLCIVLDHRLSNRQLIVSDTSQKNGRHDSLLGRLTSLLVDEVQLLGGVRRDVQFIKDEMESMNGFLLHVAEAVEEDHHQVGAWMKQVAEVAYASQNSVDRYIRSIDAGRREPGLLGYLRRLPKLVWMLPTRHRIANQIRELKIRSCEVGKRRMRYDVRVPKRDPAKVMKKAGWQAAGDDAAKQEEDAERRHLADRLYPHDSMNGYHELISFLEYPSTRRYCQPYQRIQLPNSDRLDVIAVVGKSGKGKSIVGKAYRTVLMVGSAHPQYYESLFDCKAWICLGQESTETATFLRKMLAALDSPSELDLKSAPLQPNEEEELTTRPKEKEEQELITQLQLRLKGKRFLLVIDDVRDRSLWNRVKSVFPDKHGFYRDFCAKVVIVINTPSIDVAQSFCPDLNIDFDTGSHFYLGNANRLMKIYMREDGEQLQPILKEIISKPLPVGLFLRALYVNPNKSKAELQNLCDNLDSSTTASSNNARQVLKFCNLTSNCKNCLLYMSIFPEHTIFERTRLVRRWAIEGMTAKRGRLSALDEADHCFDLLVAHGFLIPKKISNKGKVKWYGRDDTFLDIFTQIAREDHFVKNNHLYLASSDHIESQSRNSTTIQVLKSLPSSRQLGLLKVLDLEYCYSVEDHHVKIICSHAFHLKYMSLRRTDITKLPKQLDKLLSLETLDIRETEVKAFAKNSVFLPKLKLLLAGRWTHEELSTVAMPKRIGDMTELQVISHIAVSGDGSELKYVGYLLQLVKLGVVVSGNKTSSVLRHLCYATGNLGFLRSLSIQVAEIEEENENVNKKDVSPIYPKYLQKLKISVLKNGLPSWVAKLKVLTKVTLHMTFITDDDFEILGRLTSLSLFKLKQDSWTGCTVTFKKDAFQSLEFLHIDCSAITSINFDNEACLKLKRLAWYSNGEQSLLGIERLPRLKKLELTGNYDWETVEQAFSANQNKPTFASYGFWRY